MTKPGPTNGVLLACEECGATRWKFSAEAKRRRRNYCSPACAGLGRRNRRADQFWRHAVADPSGCVLWQSGKNEHGYGTVAWNGRTAQLAHRISYTLRHGAIPDGLLVLHRCDTPACVNPDHLFTGTQLDNVRDMFAKGRARPGGKDSNARISA